MIMTMRPTTGASAAMIFSSGGRVLFFGANRDHPIVIMKENIQKRTVDTKIVSNVIVDKSQLPESVHEKADTGTCGADHLCQGLLTQSRNRHFRNTFFAELRH